MRHGARRQRAGRRGEKADREWLREPRQRELVRHLLAEREPQRDLDEVDTDGVTDEIRHLATGDAGGDLDDGDAAVRRGDELREGDPVAQT